jgi:D-tyrosyl-tRNA(Tyr) deacylase
MPKNRRKEAKMIGLLQRVANARVDVDGETVGEIGRGLLVLVAVHRDDGDRDVARLAERILSYRVFPDDEGRMNRSVVDEGGALLLVPQFTLAANTRKGTRASFTRAAPPEKGEAFFRQLVAICRERLETVETGRFGANMQVVLVNDGPVTFWLES